jgi:hypothetical protein
LLAMVVNDDDVNLKPRGVLRFIASKLAPTGFCGNFKTVFLPSIPSIMSPVRPIDRTEPCLPLRLSDYSRFAVKKVPETGQTKSRQITARELLYSPCAMKSCRRS